ncbi:MAG: hypothetical protein PHY80_04090 [Rickettsiales bacterium]|nr:hypothetical protein [Rickettsiales bacterium]
MTEENNNNSQDSFANFMVPKKSNEEQKQSSSIFGKSKTQNALDEEREKDKEEKAKELLEAKKNSAALANRYGKSDMMKLQARNFIIMIPFIIIGAVMLLVVFLHGGTWLSKGINLLFNAMLGK